MKRRKKSVLLYCANEVTLSVLRFQMSVWGYATRSTQVLEEMEGMLESAPADLVLLIAPVYTPKKMAAFEAMATNMEGIQVERGSSTRIFDPAGRLSKKIAPHVFRVPGVPCTVESLRDAMRTAVARKRGPRVAEDRRAA